MRITALALLSGSLLSASSPNAPRNERVFRLLDRQVMVRQGAGINDEFFALCHTLRIPCGREGFVGESILVWPPIQLASEYRSESMTLRSALNLIVKQQPNYRWQIVGRRPESCGNCRSLWLES